MADKFDFDGLGRIVEQMVNRVGSHSRIWIAVWFAGILIVTGIAAISRAPSAAFVILLVVAMAAVFAGGGEGDSR